MFAKEYRIEVSIIFTVIVGLIGTIVGMFFNYNSIENLRKDRDSKVVGLDYSKRTYKQRAELWKKQLEVLDQLKEKIRGSKD